jgi:hypothetical protein
MYVNIPCKHTYLCINTDNYIYTYQYTYIHNHISNPIDTVLYTINIKKQMYTYTNEYEYKECAINLLHVMFAYGHCKATLGFLSAFIHGQGTYFDSGITESPAHRKGIEQRCIQGYE